ncbi:hypothetical protein MADA3029_1140077 [Vibrio nigripulchritudo MADA3029]|nr:hypothetical protein VIBNIMADA3020_10078 [Vibrio nigripulchritudo MADA3020]CCN54476.1 hypothetical protein VIBNIMADA3021_550077 [Vibrio nigripulchritudo MADA3021]CCN57526.1 hypothetical protein MADA3029_1140077 [Vibrio nigripulchritudo MADA3029]
MEVVQTEATPVAAVALAMVGMAVVDHQAEAVIVMTTTMMMTTMTTMTATTIK